VSPAIDTGVLLALVEVRFDGVALREHVVQEVRIQDSLSLPAAFSITFTPTDLSRGSDPLGIEGPKPKIGTSVEIRLGAASDKQRTKLLDGEVTAIEPSFGADGIRLVVSGYDRSHRLHRGRKTHTFQKMTTAQIVQKLAGDAGLSPKVSGATTHHEFVQQNNETDWEFLKRLASMHASEAFVDGRQLVFRELPTSAPTPLPLEFGENSSNGARLHSFYPRVSAAQQVMDVMVRSWDPQKKQKIEAKANVQQPPAAIGIKRSAVDSAFPASTITVADAPVSSISEAQELAKSVASYVAEMFVGAFGTCEGNPQVRAGTLLEIKGLGSEFSGKYRVSSATHVYGGSSGYATTFEVLGRAARDLLDLGRPATKNVWGDSLVVGVVTNNRDPETKFARIRVKYPTLDGEANEGAWARVVGVGAGNARGQMMLPQVGDEVLVGFEGGDPHKPYVLGALWNGKDVPPQELLNPKEPSSPPDGSYVLRSPKLIDLGALDNVVIKTDKDMTVEVKGKSTETVQQTQEMTVKQSFKLDAATELTLICGKAKIVLKQTGEIQITGSNVTVEGQMGATVKGSKVDVQGTGPVTVKGATVAIN
jgi:phage protein D/phage baseplate assembly protein gpV